MLFRVLSWRCGHLHPNSIRDSAYNVEEVEGLLQLLTLGHSFRVDCGCEKLFEVNKPVSINIDSGNDVIDIS